MCVWFIESLTSQQRVSFTHSCNRWSHTHVNDTHRIHYKIQKTNTHTTFLPSCSLSRFMVVVGVAAAGTHSPVVALHSSIHSIDRIMKNESRYTYVSRQYIAKWACLYKLKGWNSMNEFQHRRIRYTYRNSRCHEWKIYNSTKSIKLKRNYLNTNGMNTNDKKKTHSLGFGVLFSSSFIQFHSLAQSSLIQNV